ncbi:40S ribosomal protein S24 [Apiospora arundinis]
MADSETPVTLRTRKFIRNPLLGRKQMVVDILHPGRPNISKEQLREKISGMYKAQKDQVSVFGLRTQFGGGKTTGFALAMKKFEPQYRLVRVGLAVKPERASRQQRKQRKNRQKTLRGTAKVKGAKAKKEK